MTSVGNKRHVWHVWRVADVAVKFKWCVGAHEPSDEEVVSDTWQHVDGRMRKFLAVLCKGIVKLHSDMSYVQIGGQR